MTAHQVWIGIEVAIAAAALWCFGYGFYLYFTPDSEEKRRFIKDHCEMEEYSRQVRKTGEDK